MSETISATHTYGARDSMRGSCALDELSETQTIGQAGASSDGLAVLHRRDPALAAARHSDSHCPPLSERTRSL
jgi:hypothetical protein